MPLSIELQDLYNQVYGDLKQIPKVFGPVALIPFPKFEEEQSPSAAPFEEPFTKPLKDPVLRGDFDFNTKQGGTLHLPVKIGTDPRSENQFQLPNEPLVTIRGSKRVKETTIRRGKGHGLVTEERGLGGYRITIQGIAINDDANDYPESIVREIRRICEAEGIVYISSFRTEIWNIQKVTIRSWNMPWFQSTRLRFQPYTLDCTSDMDFEDFKRIMNEAQQ